MWSAELEIMANILKFHTLIYAILFFLLMQMAASRPGKFEEFAGEPHEDRCKQRDSTVVEVCQRCAKQTKSPIVYPLCCVNEDDVYNWCGKYINYGKKP